VTLRSPEVLADFRQVPFDHRDRLRWIARSGDELDRELRPAGVTVLTRYSHLPILHLRVPAEALSRLASDPRVGSVSPNRVARATRADGKALMHTAALASAGYSGAGITVAVLDSGVDYNHAELSPGGTDTSAKTIKGADVIDNDGDPMDEEGHGTAVAGIIAGASGGVAPAARIYAVRILDNEGNGTGSQIIAGVNDVVARVAGGNPFNIKVVNMSLGGYFEDGVPPQPCDDDIPELAIPFSTLVAAGVLPVVSGGNGGCTDGVAWPACITSTLAVGAVYDANIGSASYQEDQCTPSGCTDSTTAADTIACFSDSGAELDVWAPSFCATTTARGGGFESCFGGTSASAPYASGVAALLTHAVPARSATALHSAITNSGVDLTDARNGITRKSVRADSALATLQSGCTAPSVPTGVALSHSSACSGEPFTLSWNAVSGAASYTVQLATDANFTSLVTLTPTDTFPAASVEITLSGAYVGPLYLRVRANASCGASSPYSGSVQLQFTGGTCSTYTSTYYLSGVAHTPGVAPAFWYSDAAILNAGTSSVDLRISFNGVNSTPTPVLLTLGAHRQATWTDVLLQAFGSTTNDAGVIVVEATGPVIVLGRTYAKTTPTALSYGAAYPGMEVAQALSSGQVGYLASCAATRTSDQRRGGQRRDARCHRRVPLLQQLRQPGRHGHVGGDRSRQAGLADVRAGFGTGGGVRRGAGDAGRSDGAGVRHGHGRRRQRDRPDHDRAAYSMTRAGGQPAAGSSPRRRNSASNVASVSRSSCSGATSRTRATAAAPRVTQAGSLRRPRCGTGAR
jgi:subtilisin family serine protease